LARLAFMSQLVPDLICSPEAVRDFAELFEGDVEIFHDFLGENVGIGKIVGFFEAFVPEPELSGLALSRLTRKIKNQYVSFLPRDTL